MKRTLWSLLWRLLSRFTGDARFDEELAAALSPWMARMSRRREFLLRWQAAGFNLIPNDFLQPVPDLESIPDDLWLTPRSCEGVEFREVEQVHLLERFEAAYSGEYGRLASEQSLVVPLQFRLGNGAFESVDAELLYCFIRDLKPKAFIEVGAGQSTLLTAEAIRRNAADGFRSSLTIIEPYPEEFIRNGSIKEIETLVVEKLENVPVRAFEHLRAGDILFIDSSHVARIGGDVNHLFFEILPSLQPGVVVHIHDIVLPEEYIRGFVLDNHWFWNEQYVLHAFLMYNHSFEVLWAGNYMRVHHEPLLARAFPSYRSGKTIPGSFWMRRR